MDRGKDCPSILMVGTGEYTTGIVGSGTGSTSDKVCWRIHSHF